MTARRDCDASQVEVEVEVQASAQRFRVTSRFGLHPISGSRLFVFPLLRLSALFGEASAVCTACQSVACGNVRPTAPLADDDFSCFNATRPDATCSRASAT